MSGLCVFVEPVCAVVKLPGVPPVTADVLLDRTHPRPWSSGNESKTQRHSQQSPQEGAAEFGHSGGAGLNSGAPPRLIYTQHEAVAGGWDA